VSIYRENSDGSLIRISTLGPGTSIGEIGLYLGASRSAAVIADEPTEGFRLTRQALEDMQENNPRLSSTFHTMIARQLAGWVLQANQSLEELRKSV
jgi:SulP family sulfate permease